jgi:type I restriction enzyme, S subunit
VTPAPIGDLIKHEIGGGWGQAEPTEQEREPAAVIRGTDLPRVAVGETEGVPRRFHRASTLPRRLLREDDIVFEVSGGSKDQPVGRSMLVSQRVLDALNNRAICASFCKLIRIDPDLADPRFVFRVLQLAYVDGTLGRFYVQSTGITNFKWKPFLADYFVDLPSRDTQSRVAGVLGAIDDLIENNRRRIALLEQIAQAIFREWFVHFRYPGHEEDGLIDSPLGPIPEGWQVATLGEQLSVLESGSRPRGGVDPNERGVPSVGAENILGPGRYRFHAEKYVSQSFYDSMRRGHVEDGDVLLYKDGAYIGRHSLFRDGFPHSRCVINEHVFRLRVRPPITQSYLYFWIDRPATVEDIVSLNSNAAQPGLSQAKVAMLPMMVPTASVLKAWDEAIEPLLKLLFSLAKQSRRLVEMRELLLPGLVSGAIDISNVDLDAPPR